MGNHIVRFTGKVLIAAVVMIILGWIVFTFILPGHYVPVLPWMLSFFILIAVLTYAWQVKMSDKDVGRFTRSSMLISFLRLIIYSVFAFVVLASGQTNVAVFVVCLFFVYSVFTILEVIDLSRMVKK